MAHGVPGYVEGEIRRESLDRLPDFFIIGAMRCGTTSLYRYLSKHPDIGLSRDKETDFFLSKREFARGFEWYAKQFQGVAAAARVLGEASPNYSKCNEFPGVAERIYRHVPDARLIYIVRDPVERFISQYRHQVSSGEITIPPAEILESTVGQHYLDSSRYYRQVMEYLRFFPRERILLLCFDDLRRHPQAVMQQVFTFLGVDPAVAVDGLGRVHNSGRDLQRLPSWYFAARRSPFLRRAKRALPDGLQQALVARLGRAPRRDLPDVPDEIRAAAGAALAEDAARFRAFTGRAFEHWSV